MNAHLPLLLALSWAIQTAAIAATVLNGWKLNPVMPGLLPHAGIWVRPEYEAVIYVLFLAAFAAAGITLGSRMPGKMREMAYIHRLQVYTLIEIIIAALMLAALYKTIVYDYRSLLAERALLFLCAAAAAVKIFHRPLLAALGALWGVLTDLSHRRYVTWAADAGMVLLLFVVLCIPDYEAALARVFIGEQCCHIDHFIMAPGWAYVNGLKPYVDVLSEYGAGVPAVLTTISKLFGPFSYDSIYQTIIWMTIGYIVLYYVFLRVYFRRVLLSIAAILIGIKFILFYTMSYPLVYTYPSSTPLRCFTDVFFFLFLLGYIRSRRFIYLCAAGAVSGFAAYYVTTNGLCQVVALYACMVLWIINPQERRALGMPPVLWIKWVIAAAMPPAVWGVCMYMLLGSDLWSSQMWKNMADFMAMAKSGLISGPYWTGLHTKQLIDVAIGCFIPMLYVFTVVALGTRYLLGKSSRDEVLVIAMSVYGLGVFHHHVSMSMANNYYTMGLCYVFVLAFWLHVFLNSRPPAMQIKIGVSLVALCAYALFTNHHYISYPNLLNFSQNPMVDQTVAEPLPDRQPYFHHKFRRYTEEDKVAYNNEGRKDEQLLSEADFPTDQALKDFYHKEYDFSADAALIAKYTKPEERVALISSFEVKMLMQAKRKPLFYRFLLVDSRPMHMRHFGIANLFTTDDVKSTIAQIASHPSEYVFMEKKYLTKEVPAKYAAELYGLMDILNYVNSHYTAVEEGQYVVAMRKGKQ